MRLSIHLSYLFLLAGLLNACQNTPLAMYLNDPQYQVSTIKGDLFSHQIIENAGKTSSTLRVYIEGDGRPWWTRTQIALDPTPRKLPVLELMANDDAAAVYLGRPCYFALKDPACGSLWWTQARYSQQVVQSMNHVLDQLVKSYESIQVS